MIVSEELNKESKQTTDILMNSKNSVISTSFRFVIAIASLIFANVGKAYAQGTLRLITDLNEITEDKTYAFVTIINGNKYAVQSKDYASNQSLKIENITDNPSLFDSDNLFKVKLYSKNDKPQAIKCSKVATKDDETKYIRIEKEKLQKISMKGSWENGSVTNFYFYQAEANGPIIINGDGNATKALSPNAPSQGEPYKYCKIYTSDQNTKNAFHLYEYIEGDQPAQSIGSIDIRTDEGFGTYFISQSFVMPVGLKGAIVTEADKTNGSLNLEWKYKEGDTVPASTALLLHGSKGTYPIYAPTESQSLQQSEKNFQSTLNEESTSTNLLHGSDEDSQTTVTDDNNDHFFYKLSYLREVDSDNKILGFYWGAANGAAFKNNAHHAYLALQKTQSFEVKGFQLPKFNDVSDITTPLQPSRNSISGQRIYTLRGILLPITDTDKLPAGVYIANGQKIIRK